MGVPLIAQLEALAQVQAATDQVAAAYLKLADEHLIARVAVDSGGDIEAIRASVAQLRDLARAALITSFNRAMSERPSRPLRRRPGGPTRARRRADRRGRPRYPVARSTGTPSTVATRR